MVVSIVTALVNALFQDKTRRVIVLLTLFLVIAAIKCLSYFEIPKTLPETSIPILLYSLVSMVFSALCFLVLLVISYRPKASFQKEAKSKKDISCDALRILTVFGNHGDARLTTRDICASRKQSFNKTQLAIDELLKFDLLFSDTPWGEDTFYWLSNKGRKLLGKENLL